MTRLSGWCIDEIQARDLDRPEHAEYYHNACRNPAACPCPNHEEID